MTGSTTILILGAGYTGRHFYATAKVQGQQVLASSRDPTKHLAYASLTDRIEFDLTRQATWQNIPSAADIVWCFPATPLEQVQAFAKTLGAPPRRFARSWQHLGLCVKNDSTEYPPPWIDESAPIDLNKPRVQGEEYSAPASWRDRPARGRNLRTRAKPTGLDQAGRVGPSRKYVNLIHVEDLAAICLLALEKGKPGEVYNVSDGQPHTWNEICVDCAAAMGCCSGSSKRRPLTGKTNQQRQASNRARLRSKAPRLIRSTSIDRIRRRGGAQDGQNGFQQGPR